MRTPTLIAVTAAASAAIAAPLAVVVHDGGISTSSIASAVQQAQGGSEAGSGAQQSQALPQQQNGTSGGDTGNQTTPNSGGTTAQSSGSGTSTKASVAQSKGVVMIDTVLTSGEAAGTGMVLTAEGTVLTNYHVVSGSTQIRVTVPGGGTYTATVVGHDQTHDIAVLKLQGASNLATVKMDTDGVALSEKVLAVGQGNGEGVLYAAAGVVTGTGKSITASEEGSLSSGEDLAGLVETNAPIVGGYSGGPLFDSQGEVVGIDTAASATNSLAGYNSNQAQGYAIPISQATSIANTILAGTKTSTNHIGARAALGIAVSPSSKNTRGYGGQGATTSGVVVQQVLSGSATAGTGLAAGDTITALGTTTLNSSDDLSRVMDAQYPGKPMKVTWTDSSGTSHTATVTLQKATTN